MQIEKGTGIGKYTQNRFYFLCEKLGNENVTLFSYKPKSNNKIPKLLFTHSHSASYMSRSY